MEFWRNCSSLEKNRSQKDEVWKHRDYMQVLLYVKEYIFLGSGLHCQMHIFLIDQ